MQYTNIIVLTLALAIGAQAGVIPVANHYLGLPLVAGHSGSYYDYHNDHSGEWHDDHLGDYHGDIHGDWHDVHSGEWNGDVGNWNSGVYGNWNGERHGDWIESHDDGHYEPYAHQAAIVLDTQHGYYGHHEAQYVAQTPGALHKAPLAGHIASVAAINVAPAPGTH